LISRHFAKLSMVFTLLGRCHVTLKKNQRQSENIFWISANENGRLWWHHFFGYGTM